ncbi:hypothetical protein, partial [Nostoc sp. NMS8]|uniref:hypothetical protein n=1 Tax=Nostoc sp. NMS8 TaxID=2815392 RepID=UPI0025DDECF5
YFRAGKQRQTNVLGVRGQTHRELTNSLIEFTLTFKILFLSGLTQTIAETVIFSRGNTLRLETLRVACFPAGVRVYMNSPYSV